MKLRQIFSALLAVFAVMTTGAHAIQEQSSQTNASFARMSEGERTAFVSERAGEIARRISGTSYEFTPAFEAEIKRAVEAYANRIGNNRGDRTGTGDARFVFERGKAHAPALAGAFEQRGLSPLFGLYIPLIESEYVNEARPNSVGAIGMFQFMPQTGKRFGLTEADLLDTGKAADAAARYIAASIALFANDGMKEALAVLAYNRGEGNVKNDLRRFAANRDEACSICALTAARDGSDETFSRENVYYVPRFFAAAIIGENPQAFGLSVQPLSSYK